jgi:hypothetical protein
MGTMAIGRMVPVSGVIRAMRCGLFVLAVAISAGCAGAASGASPGTHVISWIQQDGRGVAQVWASIDDKPPIQISHRVTPPAACGLDMLGPPMFAPDLRHVVVAGGNTCGQGQVLGPLYIVDEATGSVAAVPLPGAGEVLTNQRSYGWIDSQTIFAVGAFGGGVSGVTYALGARAVAPLPGLPDGIPEAVARGSTLFFLADTMATVAGYPRYHASLNRYDLTGHTPLPGTIDLGSLDLCACATGDYHLQGWDASPDGLHVVYQVVTPQAPKQGTIGTATAHIFYAGADGANPSEIVKAVMTLSPVRIRFSPEGTLVGITEAHDTPDVASGCVSSNGLFTDPCMQFYGPDASDYPAWHWDDAYMVATAAPNLPAQIGALYRYHAPRFHGVIYVPSGYNCWSTP